MPPDQAFAPLTTCGRLEMNGTQLLAAGTRDAYGRPAPVSPRRAGPCRRWIPATGRGHRPRDSPAPRPQLGAATRKPACAGLLGAQYPNGGAAGSRKRSAPRNEAQSTTVCPQPHAYRPAPKTSSGSRPEPSDVEKSVHGLVSAVLAAGGNSFPPDLRDDTRTALVATHEAPPGTRPVDVVEFAAAAGGGTEIDSERVRGLAWFSRSWLDRLGLDATKCAIIRVRGESMEPALPDGCSIMFDRSRQDRREHGIYVVRTNGGLIVKRAVKSGRGWELVSENPAVAPEPWPADAEVVGEVVWVAQTLVGPRRR